MDVRIKYLENGYYCSTRVTDVKSEDEALEIFGDAIRPEFHETIKVIGTEIIE